MHRNPFSDAELAARLARVRAEMAAAGLDLALLSSPETIFYLTGLDHWGYFAPHLLIVPLAGDMTLVTRAMERVAVETMVRNAGFAGHADSETAADLAGRLLGGRQGAVGVEAFSSGQSFGFGTALRAGIAAAEWRDITGLVDRLRRVKSAEEQALLRHAARASDAAMAAAIGAAGEGVAEAEIAAQCCAAMIRAGGEPPGFGPFIRPGRRLGEEHTTWGTGRLGPGDRLFLELAGCVGRYHAPQGRLIHLGPVPEADARIAGVCNAAFDAACAALAPGTTAAEVYAAWQGAVDAAGLAAYRRHHCGYVVGIGVPPSWTGGNSVTGLRRDSDLVIETGMTFHILSWLMGTGQGDFFRSDCVLLGPGGAEVLTTTPAGPTGIA
jgi:Xaa-Pro dipeptidase